MTDDAAGPPAAVGNHVSGAVSGPVVQAGHIGHLHLRPDAPVALAGLPPSEPAFTGRARDLATLAQALTSPRPVLVTAVAGVAGVGKTTLAVRAASRFAGGVLFIDLRGYSANPVQPAEALSVFLHALGVPGEHVPPDAAARANLYRSVLAGRAEPVLVLADNASSADQVRPLLPGGGAHRVLITSREVLGELSAHQVRVDVLPPAEAEELIRAAVRTRNPDRVLDGPVAELARLCGHLPLALGIVAALLAEDADLSVPDLVGLVATATNRLDELAYAGNYAVRAAFELSYQRLGGAERRMFRLLSLNPGARTSAEAAAALVGEPVGRAKRLLAGLKRAHMVEPVGPGRVRFHDLLRIFAEECLARDEPDPRAAFDRLLDHYVTATRRATPRWIEVERSNLVAAVELADDDRAVDLALAIGRTFAPQERWDDWESTYRAAVAAARRRERTADEGTLLNRLAMLVLEQRRFTEARELCDRAMAAHRTVGNRHGVAVTWNNLGDLALDRHDFGEAEHHYTAAEALFRELGDSHWQAIVLNHLGTLQAWRRDLDGARDLFRHAMLLYRSLGEERGGARALTNLGNVALQTGDLAEARSSSLRALATFRALGDRLGAAKVLVNLGIVHERARMPDKAREYWAEARDVFRGFGDLESASHVERWLAELDRQR
ncbi:putative ATPase [Saccharothrix saharensis]|uniref:Putative ATPase n=1 Tax=Saccharothrix saharensis TaxID=571190 RepID=A0A543JHA6_9PSEU|nr:tetratricopeptide repeat protein [Saccharothrix saharensis]TQM82227.1 putative ATPase [Saccharothrix saharensis]